MEVRNRLGQRQAEPGAFVRAAGIEPAEASPRLLAPLTRNARAAIGDLDPDVALGWLDANLDLPARRTVADRVLDQVADGLGEQLAMAEQRHRPGRPIVDQR